MPTVQNKHNANLLNTLPACTPIVNFVTRDEHGEAVEYNENIAPKILNSIHLVIPFFLYFTLVKYHKNNDCFIAIDFY